MHQPVIDYMYKCDRGNVLFWREFPFLRVAIANGIFFTSMSTIIIVHWRLSLNS